MKWQLLALFVVGCVQTNTVRCGDQVCPADFACTSDGTCAVVEAIKACDGLADGDDCITDAFNGTCVAGACRASVCGNSKIDVGEVCDDGNRIPGDGCSEDCAKLESCGDGAVDSGEQCDDGNDNPIDACDACKTVTWTPQVVIGSLLAADKLEFGSITRVAYDLQGRLYIADYDNARVLRVDSTGAIVRIAGTGVPGFSGDGGPAATAQLKQPTSVAVDGIGRVYIADLGNSRLRRIDVDGTISTIGGNGIESSIASTGSPAISTPMRPYGIAVDQAGQLIYTDYGTNTLRVIGLDGRISQIAGTVTAVGTSGEEGPAANAQLGYAQGVAVDSQGRIILADTSNHRVRRIANGFITTLASSVNPGAIAITASDEILFADTGSNRVLRIDTNGTLSTYAGTGARGFSGDNGAPTAALLASPDGVAVSMTGTVAIADTGNGRIRTVENQTIRTVAGTGFRGAGTDLPATTVPLTNAYGIAVDASGRIVFAEGNLNRVYRIETDGRLTAFAGGTLGTGIGDGGPATQALFSYPRDVAIDAQGNTYVVEQIGHRVRKIDSTGTVTTIAGTGEGGFSGDNGPATSAQLNEPTGLAIDANGRIYIADKKNHRIRRIENGTITTFAGNGNAGFGGDANPATSAQLNEPTGVAIDGSGRLLIADSLNNRIRRVAIDNTITTIAGDGSMGSTGDGGPAIDAGINHPQGVAVDASGRVLIADTDNGRIRRIASDDTIDTIVGKTPGSGDGALAVDVALSVPVRALVAGGSMYVVENALLGGAGSSRVRRVDASGRIYTAAGLVDPLAPGPLATAQLPDPRQLVSANGTTFIAAGSSGTVAMVRNGRLDFVAGRYPGTVSGTLARFGGNAGAARGIAFDGASTVWYSEALLTFRHYVHKVTIVDPNAPFTWTQVDYAGGSIGYADGAVASSRFSSPAGLLLDGTSLYVADTGNHAIRKIDTALGTVSTFVNTGHTFGFLGDGGSAAVARLYAPTAITRCPNGDFFIADTGNARVRRVDGAGVITTVIGNGTNASGGDVVPATSSPIDEPYGLSCDAAGNLFVSSTSTLRLLPADAAGVVDGTGPALTIYQQGAAFPASTVTCLTAVSSTGANTVQVADACTGLVVELTRTVE